MRILHYFPGFLAEETGSVASTRAWCQALAGAGAEVTVLADLESPRLSPPEGVDCLPLADLRLGRRLRLPRKLRSLVRGADLFVVHSGWLLENVLACRTARAEGIPYVVTTHGAYQLQVLTSGRVAAKRAWNSLLERDHINRSLAVHIFFHDEVEGLSRLGVSPSLIVAPTGIEIPSDAKWDGGSGAYLLWLGRFDPVNKGLDLLLEAIHSLPSDERPALRLHGPDWRDRKRQVVRLVSDLGLEPWVTVGDPVYGEEKWETMARASGCVYPSRWESFGMAVAEAVSIGVPTLVAGYPLGRHLASQGAAVGVSLSPAAVAQGIKMLLSPSGAAVGQRGVEIVREQFSWPSVARSWIEQAEALASRCAPEP